MLIREAKEIMNKCGYVVIREDKEAEENKTKYFRQPRRLQRVYTGIENDGADIRRRDE